MSNDLIKISVQDESMQDVDEVLDRMVKCAGGLIAGSYSERLDISANTLKTWRARGAVPSNYLLEFAKKHNCSLDYLVYGVQNESSQSQSMGTDTAFGYGADRDDIIRIRRFGVAGGAGTGVINFDESVIQYIEMSKDFVQDQLGIRHSNIAIVGVKGSSMEPTLSHGDQVFVDLSRNRIDTNDVFAILVDGELLFKRVQLKTDGLIWLLSDNKQFQPESLTRHDADNLKVIGRVLPSKFGRFIL